MHAVTATPAEHASASNLVARVAESATDTWIAEEIGRTARLAVADPTGYRLALLGEWKDLLAARATAVTGLVTAAADDHVRRFFAAPHAWQAEHVALAATLVTFDPTPYNVSLLRAWVRLLTTTTETALISC